MHCKKYMFALRVKDKSRPAIVVLNSVLSRHTSAGDPSMDDCFRRVPLDLMGFQFLWMPPQTEWCQDTAPRRAIGLLSAFADKP